MCNRWCLDFVTMSQRWWPQAPSILEVGSLNVNGSPRDVCQGKYKSYLGVDIRPGPGVDRILDVTSLEELKETFDVVISTEMLEHVSDWQASLYSLARAVSVGGLLVLTTRSPGFEYHPYPEDNWRFTADDFQCIFSPPVSGEPFQLYGFAPDPDLRNGKSSGVGIVVHRASEGLSTLRERIFRHTAFNVHLEGARA